jgi:hypothetical protein
MVRILYFNKRIMRKRRARRPESHRRWREGRVLLQDYYDVYKNIFLIVSREDMENLGIQYSL